MRKKKESLSSFQKEKKIKDLQLFNDLFTLLQQGYNKTQACKKLKVSRQCLQIRITPEQLIRLNQVTISCNAGYKTHNTFNYFVKQGFTELYTDDED